MRDTSSSLFLLGAPPNLKTFEIGFLDLEIGQFESSGTLAARLAELERQLSSLTARMELKVGHYVSSPTETEMTVTDWQMYLAELRVWMTVPGFKLDAYSDEDLESVLESLWRFDSASET